MHDRVVEPAGYGSATAQVGFVLWALFVDGTTEVSELGRASESRDCFCCLFLLMIYGTNLSVAELFARR